MLPDHMSRANRNPITIGLATLFLAACVSSGPGPVATNPPTSAEATSTLPPLATVPSETMPPTVETVPLPPATDAPVTTAPSPCPVEGIAGEALEFHELSADLDGDGLPDRLRTFGLPTADGLLRWRARLDPASGPPSELDLADAFPPVQPLGTVQVDRNQGAGIGLAEEVLVSVGSTSDGLLIQVLTLDDAGCLARLGDALGASTTFTVGTGADRLAGLRCESTDGADRLVQLSATRASASSFVTHDTRMQRVGQNLIPETITDGTASAGGDVLPRYGMIDCSGITLPR